MSDFKISVLIPAYNVEKYIEQAVSSALMQPETEEVVIVEDGSQDNTLEICKKLERKNNKIKVFQHPDKKNHGAGPTRNLALKMTTQPYVAFLDGDDYYLENRFSKTWKIFEKIPDADGVYECLGSYFETQENKRRWNEQNRPYITTLKKNVGPNYLFEELIAGRNGYFSIDTLTFKREKLRINEKISIGFSDIRLSQDLLFIWKLASIRKLYPGEVNKPVAIRRVHDNNRHTKSETDSVYYKVKAWEELLDWLITINLYPQIQRHLKTQIFSKKIDLSLHMEDILERKKIQLKLFKNLIKDNHLIYSKYNLKLFLALTEIFKFIKS